MHDTRTYKVSKTPLEIFATFQKYYCLEQLTIQVCHISEYAIELLAIHLHDTLHTLTISNANNTFTSYLSLSHMTNLTSLALKHLSLGSCLQPLQKLTQLKSLEISSCDINDQMVMEILKDPSFPLLEHLNLDYSLSISKASANVISKHTSLKTLSLQMCCGINVTDIKNMCRQLQQLCELNIFGVRSIRANVVFPPRLTHLLAKHNSFLVNHNTIMPGFRSLLRSPHIQLIDLDNTRITELQPIVKELCSVHRNCSVVISVHGCVHLPKSEIFKCVKLAAKNNVSIQHDYHSDTERAMVGFEQLVIRQVLNPNRIRSVVRKITSRAPVNL
jgi:hypothetical protein